MTIKLKNCSFVIEIIDYVGHGIPSGKAPVSKKHTKAINALQYLSTESDVRLLPELGSVYQGFVPSFTKGVSSLNTKLKKREPLQINLEKEKIKAVDGILEK